MTRERQRVELINIFIKKNYDRQFNHSFKKEIQDLKLNEDEIRLALFVTIGRIENEGLIQFFLDELLKVNKVNSEMLSSALFHAAYRLNPLAINLLVEYGGDINVIDPDTGQSLLHYSVVNESIDELYGPYNENYITATTEEILRHGINPYIVDNEHSQAIDYAFQYGNKKDVELIGEYMKNYPDKPEDWKDDLKHYFDDIED